MDTIDWGKKWIIDFNAGKTNLGSFEQFVTLVLFMQKWEGRSWSKMFLKRRNDARIVFLF